MSDVELVEALRGDDAAAQGRQQGTLGRWSAGWSAVLGPGLDPSDMVQEVFIRVFARLDELRTPPGTRLVVGIALGVARNRRARATAQDGGVDESVTRRGRGRQRGHGGRQVLRPLYGSSMMPVQRTALCSWPATWKDGMTEIATATACHLEPQSGA